MNDPKFSWVLAGYTLFAKSGPSALKVEALARKVGKNKSSFYHFFADPDIFIDHLLDYHRERSRIMAEKEGECRNVDPELLMVILDFREDVLFNRQLRVHRNTPRYRKCLEQTNQEVAGAILEIWAEALGLSGQTQLAGVVLKLSLENFFLQITEDTLNYEWLSGYVGELRTMVRAFQHSKPV